MTRNLIYSIYPSTAQDVWIENVGELRRFWSRFNGRKIVTIVSGRGLVPPEEVRSAASFDDDTEVIVAPNDPVFGEVPHFFHSLSLIASTSEDEITFYAHTKGASRPADDGLERNIRLWRSVMYRECLGDPARIERALEISSCCGCFRRKGRFGNIPHVNWHYSGAFFWFRHSRLFRENEWQTPDGAQGRYGVEGYLGRFFSVEESACLVGDDAGNLYKANPLYLGSLLSENGGVNAVGLTAS